MQKQKTPLVYSSVRAVGTMRPKFNPASGRVFSDELKVVGTAFWLKDYKVLITCAHVVELFNGPIELAGLLVVGKAGNYRRAAVAALDLQHDLAVLTLLDNNNEPLSGEELTQEAADGLEIVTDYAPVSSEVSYAGFPLGDQLLDKLHSPTYSEGVVGVEKKEMKLRKEIQISGAVVGGFSGSPIVLKDSNSVIGVVSNGPQDASNIFMAISWQHVAALAKLATS